MTEINAEKNKIKKNDDQSEVPHPSSAFLNLFFSFPRWFQPYADRSGDRRSRETILKIAQSGRRFSREMSAPGDGLLVQLYKETVFNCFQMPVFSNIAFFRK